MIYLGMEMRLLFVNEINWFLLWVFIYFMFILWDLILWVLVIDV